MSPFWTGDYFSPSYWPEGYFGPEQETNPGAMSATLAGSGGLTATASAIADITGELVGTSAIVAALDNATAPPVQPPVLIGGGWAVSPRPAPIPAFLSARLSGAGQCVATPSALADLSAAVAGSGTLAGTAGAAAGLAASIEAGGALAARGTARGKHFVADNQAWLLAA